VSVKGKIEEKLTRAFQPDSLQIVDESHLHAGHAGHRPEGETHFRVRVVSKAFAGKSRVQRHRMVNSVLAEELAGPVHALAIHSAAPGEEGQAG
jgi:BolA protein